MIQVDHVLPRANTMELAPGAAWDTIAALWPANATEEVANDFVWFLTDH